MRFDARPVILSVSLLALAACATTRGDAPAAAAAPPAPAAAVATPPYLDRALAHGEVLLGTQPSGADFAALRAAGVTSIVNLRSQEEMATIGFDPALAAREAGLDYLHSPVAGTAAFTPELLDAFAREMERADGRVLLHCASGARAGQLYAAWLVRERGYAPDAAMREVAPLGLWPLPMERMLGQPLSLGLAGRGDGFEAKRD
jgi:uncharacterized protein (TIGR01244 family)